MPTPLGIDLLPVVSAPRESGTPSASNPPSGAGESSFQDHLARASQPESPVGPATPPRPASSSSADRSRPKDRPTADQQGTATGQPDTPPPDSHSEVATAVPESAPGTEEQQPDDEVVLSDVSEVAGEASQSLGNSLAQAAIVSATAQATPVPEQRKSTDKSAPRSEAEPTAGPKRARGPGHAANGRPDVRRPAAPPASGRRANTGEEKPSNASPNLATPAPGPDGPEVTTASADQPAVQLGSEAAQSDARVAAPQASSVATSPDLIPPVLPTAPSAAAGASPTASDKKTVGPTVENGTPTGGAATGPAPAVVPPLPDGIPDQVRATGETSRGERPRRPAVDLPETRAAIAAAGPTVAEVSTNAVDRADSALASLQILAAALPATDAAPDKGDAATPPRVTASDAPATSLRNDPPAAALGLERARPADVPTASAGTSSAPPHGPLREAERVRLIQRVSRAFETALERGSPLRLRLSPPELGSVRLELHLRDGKLEARVEAETPAAQAVLLDNVGALRDRLHEHKIELERFEVEIRDQPAGGRSAESDQRDPRAAPEPRDEGRRTYRGRRGSAGDEAPIRPPAAPGVDGSGRLNIVI